MTQLVRKYFELLRQAEAEGGSGGEVTATAADATADATASEAASTAPESTGSDAPAAASAAAGTGEALPKEDWKDKRISKLTARLRELEEKTAAVSAVPAASPATGGPLDPTADFEARVAAAAADRLAAASFAKACNDAAAAGKKEFGADEFNQSVANLQRVVNQTDPAEVTAYNNFLKAAVKSGAAHSVIHALGQDLNKATELLALDPTEMAIEVAKMALAQPEPSRVSEVPKPIRTVGGTAAGIAPIDPTDKGRADSLSTAEWMARREAQLAAGRVR